MLKPVRFWKRFQSPAIGQQNPVHIRRAFSEDEFNFNDVIQILRALREDVSVSSSALRVYVENCQSYAHEDRVIHEPPRSNEPLEDWGTKIFEGRRYGLILNYVEQWNDQLCRKLAHLLAPIQDVNVGQKHTFEVNLFIGNYGYTPFGAHWDDEFSNIVHLHLGPNPKTMTLWSPAAFRRITGSSRSYFHPEKIVRHGRSYRLQEGDIFLLPPNYFHVGLTRDFSVGLAIVISPQSANKIFEQALSTASEELAAGLHVARSQSVKRSLSQAQAAINQSPDKFRDWVRISVERHLLQQASLRGFCAKPRERTRRVRITKQKVVIAALPFKLSSFRTNSSLHLFIRGVEITLRANHAVEDLIRLINTGRPLNVRDLISRYSEQLEEEAIVYLLVLMHKYRGIDIAE